MLHPALIRALATAHIEDLQRAAARKHTIRLARRARATRGGVGERADELVAETSMGEDCLKLSQGSLLPAVRPTSPLLLATRVPQAAEPFESIPIEARSEVAASVDYQVGDDQPDCR
jgi:hypothetical protein